MEGVAWKVDERDGVWKEDDVPMASTDWNNLDKGTESSGLDECRILRVSGR